jgi:hypothetical protein
MFSLKGIKLKDVKQLASIDEIKSLTDDLTDDSGENLTKWHLTPLGRIVSLVLLLVVGFGLVVSILPTNANQAAKKAATAKVLTGDIQRVFTTTDAVDFTQLAYGGYLAGLAADTPPAITTKAPYDRNTMLLRLERIRTKLDFSLYKELHNNYVVAVEKNDGIKRDEILCSPYDFGFVKAYLKQGGRETAVVIVKRVKGPDIVGSFEVTVDLKLRNITDINCL